MHHIYTTEAFVIKSSPYGEADKFFLLFTKSFGMVGAHAQGIRLNQSKLRYHLQDFAFSNVSLVRGKEVWRITGANELEHEKIGEIHLKILKLLKRLLHGEEKNEELFEIVRYLYQSKIDESDLEVVESLTVLRILNSLGYIRSDEITKNLLENNLINSNLLEKVRGNKTQIVKAINQALTESQL
jgi:DNA repair protein RecO